jgi:hypothetical protein
MNIAQARHDLLNADAGFHVIRGLYSPEEVDSYRKACERFMSSATRIHERVMTDRMPDYVHPRSHDQVERTARIYQYFHNHRGDEIGLWLDRAMSLRNQIESAWLDEPAYLAEKNSLLEYVIVTQYHGNRGMLPRHNDYCGPAPKPLIQFWVALSEHGKDYEGGNLVLHTKSGKRYRVESDLGLKKGDALVFDKTVDHEVELTKMPSVDAIGRWTVLIGARAPRDGLLEALRKRALYGPPLYPFLSWGSRTLKGLARQK